MRLFTVERPHTNHAQAHAHAPGVSQTLIAAFSALAMLLSVSGIFAVMSFTVARRTREIGIRVALGAP